MTHTLEKRGEKADNSRGQGSLLGKPPTEADNTFVRLAKCYRQTCSKYNGFHELG